MKEEVLLLFIRKQEARDLTHDSEIKGVFFHQRGRCPGAILVLTIGTCGQTPTHRLRHI